METDFFPSYHHDNFLDSIRFGKEFDEDVEQLIKIDESASDEERGVDGEFLIVGGDEGEEFLGGGGVVSGGVEGQQVIILLC